MARGAVQGYRTQLASILPGLCVTDFNRQDGALVLATVGARPGGGCPRLASPADLTSGSRPIRTGRAAAAPGGLFQLTETSRYAAPHSTLLSGSVPRGLPAGSRCRPLPGPVDCASRCPERPESRLGGGHRKDSAATSGRRPP